MIGAEGQVVTKSTKSEHCVEMKAFQIVPRVVLVLVECAFSEMWDYLSAGGHEAGDVAAWNTQLWSWSSYDGGDGDDFFIIETHGSWS